MSTKDPIKLREKWRRKRQRRYWRDPQAARAKERLRKNRRREENQEYFREAWRAQCKEYNLQNQYGISLEQFEARRKEQGDRCAICHEEFGVLGLRPVVDHHHKTGKFRAVLCNNCNVGLGKLRENPELMRKAADYLTRARL
jgi:hypothetical protein